LRLLTQGFIELPANLRRHLGVAGFALQGLEDHVEIVSGNPLCKELVGNPKYDGIALDAAELNRFEPGLEVLSRQVRLEAAQSLFPQSFHRHQVPKKHAIQRSRPQAIHTSLGRAIQTLFTNLRRRGDRQLVSSQ